MAKIAVEHKMPDARMLASGEGWKVCDVTCAAGPCDPAFEEQHSQTSVAVVVSGTFQYRTSTGRELMMPGSILLGNMGEPFTCGHEHGVGDRCISFHYSEEFSELAELNSSRQLFRIPRIPAIRATSPHVARVTRILSCGADHAAFEEVAYHILDSATRLQDGIAERRSRFYPSSLARVTRVLRAVEATPDAPHTLSEMAENARLSPWHFLRCFEELTGATPRQYLLRMRLRKAAVKLKQDSTRIVDIAFDCGFGDVSNFNRAFRAEFGTTPSMYRAACASASSIRKRALTRHDVGCR